MLDSAPLRALSDTLDKTRGRLRRAVFVEALATCTAGLALIVVGGTLASRAGVSTGNLAVGEVLFTLILLGAVVVRYTMVASRSAGTPSAVARWLDKTVGVRSGAPGFLSALELHRDRGQYEDSEALVDASLERASKRGANLDPGQLVKDAAWPTLKPRMIGLGAGMFVLAILGAAMPNHVVAAVSAIGAVDRIEDALVPPPPEPRFGDLRLTYRFPGYAKRKTRTVQSATGEIHALAGTEILIETRSRHPLKSGALIVTHGETNDDQNRTAIEVDGRQVRATLVVGRAGRYHFRVETKAGEILEERRGRPIQLELDTPPEVKMTKPKETPLEVNENDRVAIGFEAEDDFGLSDISVAWRVLGTSREGKQLLTISARGQRRAKGVGQLDLSKLKLQPGDRVSYSVEAGDNDTVNGPKFGASVTQELRVYSKDAHHREVMALADQALDELVHVLGDNLDGPIELKEAAEEYKKVLDASEKIVLRTRGAAGLLQKAIEAIREDPLGRKEIATAFESVRKDLVKDNRLGSRALNEAIRRFTRHKQPDERQTRRANRAQMRMINRLEKNVVYLADLLNDQRMLDAESLMKELRAEQQKLSALLEEYKNAPTEEKRRALMEAIEQVKKRITEIMKDLASIRDAIPQDFVNTDAMSKDQMADMNKVQELIEKGDLQAAMDQLDQMLNATEKMMAQMQSGREQLGQQEYGEIQKMAKELMKTLEETEKTQRELARKTDQQAQKTLERMKKRLGDADKFVETQLERLKTAKKHIDKAEPGLRRQSGGPFDQLARRIEDAKKGLEVRDFGATREMLQMAEQLLHQLGNDARQRAEQARRFGDFIGNADELEKSKKSLDRAQPALQKVLEDLDKLMPKPSEMLSPQERAELEKLSEEQGQLRNKAGQLQKQLERLGQELPMVGEGMKQIVSEADQAMGEASQGLGKGDAPGSQGSQRRALDKLNQLRDALQQSGQSGQGGGGGMPLPFGGGSGQKGGKQGNGRDPSSEKVEIPRPEQYQAPAEFREEILEAAKQGTAEAYKEAVRRYYEEIVK